MREVLRDMYANLMPWVCGNDKPWVTVMKYENLYSLLKVIFVFNLLQPIGLILSVRWPPSPHRELSFSPSAAYQPMRSSSFC